MTPYSKSDYAKDRLDPRWQKRRLEVMQRDAFCCARCFDSESTLNVHHAYYVKGRKPWEYPDFALSTLCSDCHSRQHDTGPKDEEDKVGLMEWEEEMNWLLNSQEIHSPFLWVFCTQVAQLFQEGGEVPYFYEKLAEFVRKHREDRLKPF